MREQCKIVLFFLAVSLALLASTALAKTNVDVYYDETDLGNGSWLYEYTFLNDYTDNFLYSVRLDFDALYSVTDPDTPYGWSGFWGSLSPTFFMETHSNSTGYDIAPGSRMNGFSFIVDSQIGSTPFTAFVDESESGVYSVSGFTAENISVAPEPISTVLFLTGGITLAAATRLKRKSRSLCK